MGSFGIGFPLSGASPMWVFYNARVTFRTTSVSIHTESATQQGWSAPPTRYRRVIMPRAFHSATFMLPQCNRGREGVSGQVPALATQRVGHGTFSGARLFHAVLKPGLRLRPPAYSSSRLPFRLWPPIGRGDFLA